MLWSKQHVCVLCTHSVTLCVHLKAGICFNNHCVVPTKNTHQQVGCVTAEAWARTPEQLAGSGVSPQIMLFTPAFSWPDQPLLKISGILTQFVLPCLYPFIFQKEFDLRALLQQHHNIRCLFSAVSKSWQSFLYLLTAQVLWCLSQSVCTHMSSDLDQQRKEGSN